MTMTYRSLAFAATVLLCIPLVASAEAGAGGHHEMRGAHADAHKGKHDKKAHHFTSHWAKTLSDEQKVKVDMMHLELSREQAVSKAQAELAQKEINVLTANDKADMKAIEAKIDELLAIKKQIMRARYAHILEMRGILTPEQRISYDMGILKRRGAK